MKPETSDGVKVKELCACERAKDDDPEQLCQFDASSYGKEWFVFLTRRNERGGYLGGRKIVFKLLGIQMMLYVIDRKSWPKLNKRLSQSGNILHHIVTNTATS